MLTAVSVPLGDQLTYGGTCVWRAVAQGPLQAQMETRRILCLLVFIVLFFNLIFKILFTYLYIYTYYIYIKHFPLLCLTETLHPSLSHSLLRGWGPAGYPPTLVH